MSIPVGVLAAIVGYLVGAISFGRVVARFVAPTADLDTTEIGAADGEGKVVLTSVSSTSIGARKGPKWGCLAGILDILKAFIPTLVFRLLYPGTPYYLITSGATIIGHNWPIYYGFRGGRGISAIMGSMLAVDWLGLLVTNLVSSLLAQFVLRIPMAGFSLSLPFLIPWFALTTRSWWHIGYSIAVNVIYWVAVIPELRTYIGLRREGRGAEFFAAMSETPMGRGRRQLAAQVRSLIGRMRASIRRAE
jgi:glycerol-3-phosphate acyltransferase PlsY